MKKILVIITLCLSLLSCWNPSVKEVAITGDWQHMELPIKNDARVWACDDNQLKIVHKDSRKTVAQNYLESFENHGWTLTKQNLDGNEYNFRFAKGNTVLDVEIYDFEKTGVIIRKM
jgi:hypothetical protein